MLTGLNMDTNSDDEKWEDFFGEYIILFTLHSKDLRIKACAI